ncbi:MAG: hypothetical protein LBD03_03500 [Methanobrevibacter sp.]|nr:hypothetical protein [Candidatus Methanovirga procula]
MGIVKIFNKKDRVNFSKRYFDYVKQMLDNKKLMDIIHNQSDPTLNTPDLIAEQLNLRNCLIVNALIKETDIKLDNNEDLGFIHLVALDKFKKMKLILEKLKKIDVNIFNKLISKWEDYNFSVN